MNDGDFHPALREFSAGYRLVENAEVVTYPEDDAQMGLEMYDALTRRFGRHFLGKVGNSHYEFERGTCIPAGMVAVPERNHDDPDALLIQK
jgi:hypothetical protein